MNVLICQINDIQSSVGSWTTASNKVHMSKIITLLSRASIDNLISKFWLDSFRYCDRFRYDRLSGAAISLQIMIIRQNVEANIVCCVLAKEC